MPEQSSFGARLAFVAGTRPEAIKLAPVILAARDAGYRSEIVSTGQHPEILSEALSTFGLTSDIEFGVFGEGQSLSSLLSRVTNRVDDYLARESVDLLVVQGDTTSAAGAAVAASYRRTPVVHVEAGLRTGRRDSPFPEEINRRLIAVCTDVHLAPTAQAAANLAAEGVDPKSVTITGNTVIDALHMVRDRLEPSQIRPAIVDFMSSPHRTLLVTTHRREVWGEAMSRALRTIREVADRVGDVQILLPAHPNPIVRDVVIEQLGRASRHLVCDPLSYEELVYVMSSCYLVATDSGGIQEEAPGLGKPVLVLRDTTERPEGVEAGVARLVGTDPDRIRRELTELLTSEAAFQAMTGAANPYGDGRAAGRCIRAISCFLDHRD